MKRLYLWGWSSSGCAGIPALLSSELYKICYWVGSDEKCTHNIFSIIQGKLGHIFYGKERKHYTNVYENINTFIGMYSRHTRHYSHQRYDDYINLFNQYYDYFVYQLTIEKIDTVLFSNIPHEGPDYVLYLIAKELGIKVIITHQSQFPNRFFVLRGMDDFGVFNSTPELSPYKNIEIPQIHKKDLFYMRNIERPKNNIHKLTRLIINRKLERACIEYENIKRRIRYQKYLENNTLTSEDYPELFVYFPLHLQPELTTSALGGRYSDQILAIEELHSVLPGNWSICVKENPKQTEYMRGTHFYKRLAAMNKVKLFNPSVDTYELIMRSQFVATISGTAGWEAITGGKNVLIFGQAWYQSLPGVTHFKEFSSIDEILNKKINHSELEKRLSDLMVKTGQGVVDGPYSELVQEYTDDENARSVSAFLSQLIK